MTLRCVQLGCGDHRLPQPWENFDAEIDITQRLPFGDATIDRILCEHTIEHVPQEHGIAFLQECHRVLVPGGIVRVSFPAPELREWSPQYRAFVADRQGGGTTRDVLRFIMWGSGHRAIWTAQIAECVLYGLGFTPMRSSYGVSIHAELHEVDGHHHAVGIAIAAEETVVFEATKDGARA